MPKLPVDPEYFAGFIEGSGDVSITVCSTDSHIGVRIQPHIRITVYDEVTHGMVDACLDQLNVTYRTKSRDSIATQLRVTGRSNVKALLGAISPHLQLTKKEAAFILEVVWSKLDSGELRRSDGFLRALKTYENIRPRRLKSGATKYTVDSLSEEFGVDTAEIEPYTLSPTDEVPISDEYAAGLFDGCGKISPLVTQKDSAPQGFKIAPELSLQRASIDDEFAERMNSYAETKGFEFSHSPQLGTLRTSSVSKISEFLKHIHPHLVRQFLEVEYTRDVILPLFQEGIHNTSRQGFYECLFALSAVKTQSRSAQTEKYTPEFFKFRWGSDVDTESFDHTPGSNPLLD